MVPEYKKLKRQCTELFKEGKVRDSKSPYAAPIVMVRKSIRKSIVMDQFDFVLIIARLTIAR